VLDALPFPLLGLGAILCGAGPFLWAATTERPEHNRPLEVVYGAGHGGRGHRPDWTWEDPAKAMKMAEMVFKELKELAKSHVGNCAETPWDRIKDDVSKFVNHKPKPSSFYLKHIFGPVFIDNVTFEGYDEKIKELDHKFSLDKMYKTVRKCKAK